jgi:hypothetical protein
LPAKLLRSQFLAKLSFVRLLTAQFVERGAVAVVVPQFLADLFRTATDAASAAEEFPERCSHDAVPYL